MLFFLSRKVPDVYRRTEEILQVASKPLHIYEISEPYLICICCVIFFLYYIWEVCYIKWVAGLFYSSKAICIQCIICQCKLAIQICCKQQVNSWDAWMNYGSFCDLLFPIWMPNFLQYRKAALFPKQSKKQKTKNPTSSLCLTSVPHIWEQWLPPPLIVGLPCNTRDSCVSSAKLSQGLFFYK